VKTKTILPLFTIVLFLFSCNQQTKRSEMKSLSSLKTTIEGEITANAKYLAYAQQARQDSMYQIAALFDAAAIAEKAHADRQITMLLTLGGSFSKFDPQYAAFSIKDNLQDAIEIENYEAMDMYPGFIIISKEEGLEDITESFEWALQAEEKHRDFFKLAIASLDDPDIILPSAYMVCPRCGNTMDASDYNKPCDICENDASKFVRVE
jgi:rubrerythrin